MLNLDFKQRVVINTHDQEWVPSPAGGVLRKLLAREDMESGHATSIVQYQKGAKFNTHPHPLGEEILVLEGVFSDESGDYGKGSYIRNPPGSSHAPYSVDGCIIFVKLHQFSADDKQQIVINTLTAPWEKGLGQLEIMPLHEHGTEHVALVKWPAGEVFPLHSHLGGEEFLVLSGLLEDEHGQYPEGTWVREPVNSEHQPFAREDTIVWMKTGHLTVN